MKRLLVVEDEYSIRDLLNLNLTRVGYTVDAVESAEKAIEIFSHDPERFDVAVIDIMLPGMSGFELCEWIRRKNQIIGIIMLTARTMEPDKVKALALGADGYVTKPFSLNELIARVDAIYRRTMIGSPKLAEGKELTCGDFVLDLSSRLLIKRGKPLDLTQVEFQIMELFFKNQGVALDRETIMGKVWGTSYYGDVKIVDVNIRRLRMKVEDDPSNPSNIVTVWGYGYRWTT